MRFSKQKMVFVALQLKLYRIYRGNTFDRFKSCLFTLEIGVVWTFQRWFQGWFPCRWIVVPTLLKLFVAELIPLQKGKRKLPPVLDYQKVIWCDSYLPQAFKISGQLRVRIHSLIRKFHVSIIGVTDLIYQLNIRSGGYRIVVVMPIFVRNCCCTLSLTFVTYTCSEVYFSKGRCKHRRIKKFSKLII